MVFRMALIQFPFSTVLDRGFGNQWNAFESKIRFFGRFMGTIRIGLTQPSIIRQEHIGLYEPVPATRPGIVPGLVYQFFLISMHISCGSWFNSLSWQGAYYWYTTSKLPYIAISAL